ncbi:MAG: hypothetical protein PHI16_01545 [Methanocellales archaeon]|nr:hypothetical protein [Methanocellales archaeon]
MNKSKNALIITLFVCMDNGRKHYTKVRIDKILELMRLYHGINIKRRWVFSCINDLETQGYIKRKKRFKNQEEGHIYQLSSLISLTLCGAKYLLSKNVQGARNLYNALMNWIKRKDKRFPTGKDILPGLSPGEIEINLAKVRKLLSDIA